MFTWSLQEYFSSYYLYTYIYTGWSKKTLIIGNWADLVIFFPNVIATGIIENWTIFQIFFIFLWASKKCNGQISIFTEFYVILFWKITRIRDSFFCWFYSISPNEIEKISVVSMFRLFYRLALSLVEKLKKYIFLPK